ncbi:Wzz/FepE/Etk N-terminal domain-containing protein [Devosia sp. 2618]|uniref:GumC family protein n=1 Tax=Devosia sp. 2618 TaxID=3156454 RepID=UPI003396A920
MQDAGLELHALFNLVRRQLRLILATALGIFLLAIIIAFSLPPTYTASALVMVDPATKNLLSAATDPTSSSSDNARIDSEVEIIASDNVLRRVVDAQNLTRAQDANPSTLRQFTDALRLTPSIAASEDIRTAQALNDLRAAVTVHRRNATFLIDVAVRSPSPDDAARLANAITTAYVAAQIEAKVDSVLAGGETINARVAQARAELQSTERALDSFVDDTITRIANEDDGGTIAALRIQIRQVLASRTANEQASVAAQSSLQTSNFAAVAATLQTATLADIERRRAETAAALANADDASPAATALRGTLSQIETEFRTEATTQIDTLNALVRHDKSIETALLQQVRQAALASPLPADVLTNLFDLQQGAELARAQYQTLVQRSQELSAQADLQLADSRVVSAATVPITPTAPNRPIILIIALIAAIGLGLGVALLYDSYVGGFTNEQQLSGALPVQRALAVPRRPIEDDQLSVADFMVHSQLSLFAESVRRLRAMVDQVLREPSQTTAQGKLIMVTSATAEEGKSSLALALARSYALSGRSTLVVDGDLRKPSLHHQLGLEPNRGLLEYLTVGASGPALAGIVAKDTLSDATILLGARQSEFPTDQLLSGKTFAELIAQARQNFEIIILDTPPAGTIADALYVAHQADLIAFVVKWSRTSQSSVRTALAALFDAGGRSVPTIAILNQQELNQGSYRAAYGEQDQTTA